MSAEPSKTLSVARRLIEAGISVLPTKPGEKTPAVPKWTIFQQGRADAALVSSWFKNGNGLAIICGKISGNLEGLDFDVTGIYEEYAQACADNGLAELLESCCLIETPSGGRHLYYRCTLPVGGNKKLARAADGSVRIETRGEGGYARTFPTEGYKLLRGRTDNLPVLSMDARSALLAVARLFDEMPPKEAEEAEPHTSERDGENTPVNDYNARGDYEGVLEAHGWKRLHRHGSRQTWTRPGKDGNVVSATTGYAGTRMLYVFSTNAVHFEIGRKYSPYAVYALLEHGGDFSAATRKLGELGFGEPPAAPKKKRETAKKASEQADAPTADGESAEVAEGKSQFKLAQAWAKENEGRFCYVEGDQWWHYAGNRWQYSSSEMATRSVQEFLEKTKFVTPARIRNILYMAKSMVGPIQVSSFNSHPGWIPLRNGVFDTVTGLLMPHDPKHLLTYQLPYDYAPDADCPVWKRCLSEWLLTESGETCLEWVDLIQEWFGYCLIPDNTAQVSMFWLGGGQNGKGVTTRALTEMLGHESCTSIPIDQLHDPYHRAELQGKMVGFANEPDKNAMKKNGPWFKLITGGDDLISARRPTEKVFTFRSVCRVIVTCNVLPETNDPSRAYFRRILPIDWRYQVSEEAKDPDLDDKVKAEMPGIFNWALVGLARIKGRGKKFGMPKESAALLEQYRQDQDHLLRFLTEEVTFERGAKAPSSELYNVYKGWCEGQGIKWENDNNFGRRLSKHGCTRAREYFDFDESGGVVRRQTRVWTGVRLQSEREKEKRESPEIEAAPEPEKEDLI